MELLGKIKLLGEVQTYGNDFTKKEVVITTLEQYPQDISIEFVKGAIDKLDGFKVGQNVKIGINIKGREWTNPDTGQVKHFNSIQGWRIEAYEDNAEVQQPVTESAEEGDLPF